MIISAFYFPFLLFFPSFVFIFVRYRVESLSDSTEEGKVDEINRFKLALFSNAILRSVF